LHALDHHLDQLADDHRNARRLADRLAEVPGIVLDPAAVRTNIVIFHLAAGAPDAATMVEQAAQRGVLMFAFGPRTIRLVTHRDVSAEQCREAAEALAGIVE